MLHVWRGAETAAPESFTASDTFDWAFCTPVLGKACRGWGLYVAGRFNVERTGLTPSSDPTDLREDVKFTELVAAMLSSLRQMRLLEHRHATLSQFFSPVVLDTLAVEDPEIVLAPRETEVSVLFCDLRGFSRESERQAGDLLGLLQRVSKALGVMTHHIREQGGVVGDFQGDAAMGFWGWPLPQNDAVLRTCRAALAVRAEFEATAGFHAGIGVATGQAVAGKIGTVDQVKVTVFGPVVNLASRLEGMTKILQAPILLDEATARIVRQQVPREVARVRRLAIVRPYGLDTPLEVSELLPPAVAVSRADRRAPGILRGGARCVPRPAVAGGLRASAPHPGGGPGEGFSGGLHRPAQPPPAAGLGRGDSVGEQVGGGKLAAFPELQKYVQWIEESMVESWSNCKWYLVGGVFAIKRGSGVFNGRMGKQKDPFIFLAVF